MLLSLNLWLWCAIFVNSIFDKYKRCVLYDYFTNRRRQNRCTVTWLIGLFSLYDNLNQLVIFHLLIVHDIVLLVNWLGFVSTCFLWFMIDNWFTLISYTSLYFTWTNYRTFFLLVIISLVFTMCRFLCNKFWVFKIVACLCLSWFLHAYNI